MSDAAEKDDTLRTRFARLNWVSDRHVEIEGVRLEFCWDFKARPDASRLMILKHPSFMEDYVAVMGDRSYRNVLELGVFDGGSCILFADLFGVERLVAVELNINSERFDLARANSPIGKKIGVHYSTSQDDAAALNRIVDTEFDGPPDLIVDDASHFLDETTRSFEILWPRLKPGGWYVIEDWSWAHFPGSILWAQHKSLSVLAFKLLAAYVAHPELIAEIVMKRHMMFIRKADTAPLGGEISVEAIAEMNGRVFQPF